jgi:RNA polymerase sigma factor (sigma-70 family)
MDPLTDLLAAAKSGDRGALEALVRAIQDRVYGLCVRMLGDPADAKDATQEVLVKVITQLGAFRGESAFTTWVHRVAANHLLTVRKRRAESMEMTFEKLGAMIDEGLEQADPAAPPPDAVLAEEVRITCTEGMLLSLDREHRLAYVLGEILELTSEEAAAVLEISAEAFRKRLSRARATLQKFMKSRCGVFDARNQCRCSLQVPYTRRTGMLDPNALRFATHPARGQPHHLRELVGLLDVAAIYRSHPDYAAPDDFVDAIKGWLKG